MAQQQELAQPRRRVRTSRTTSRKRSKVTGASEKLKLDQLTRQMRDAQQTIDAAKRTLDLKAKEAFETMQAAKIQSHSCPEGDLKIKVPSGRSSTTIRVKEFHQMVEDDEFYDCVSVSVTKARSVLSGKEITECSDTKPAVAGAPRLDYEFYTPEGTDEDD